MADEQALLDWAAPCRPYVELLRTLIDRQLSGDEFQDAFFALYLNDSTMWPDQIFSVLDGFFADVDDFTPDPDLRIRTGGLDEEQLRERARLTISRLTELVGPLES